MKPDGYLRGKTRKTTAQMSPASAAMTLRTTASG
jgi:hypothetical protein